MALHLPSAQTELAPGDIVEDGIIKVTASPGSASVDDRAKDLGAKVWAQVQHIISTLNPDTLHVFTHAGSDPAAESLAGLFNNRGGYFSALRRTTAIDHFTETVIPVDVPEGEVAFKVEGIVTSAANNVCRFVKDVAAASQDSWGTLATNKNQNVGSHSSGTRLFIGLGFGLRRSISQGLIMFNPIGPVRTLMA